MKITKEIKDYLSSPDSTNVFYIETRIDFDSVKLAEHDEIIDDFLLNFQKIKSDEDFLEDYYIFEDKKFIYNKKLEILIVKVKDIFIILCIKKKNIEEFSNKVNKSKLSKYITLSEIESLKNSSLSTLLYPFLFHDFINNKNNYTIELYDKLVLSLNSFTNGLKEKNNIYHYMSFILLSSLLEELFVYIAKKENISLDKTWSISDCIEHLEGKMSLKVKHPDSVKVNKNNGEKQLVVLSEQNNSNKIFTKKDKVIGKKIIILINELKDIRTKYVHFVTQKPNNPSDNLIGIVNFGQFLIWCEENDYI